ncbi:MAG TPA: acyltransferase family protein [Clostridia bacterium]|nr:acyltransferase family protein [Clostridia bacterium]
MSEDGTNPNKRLYYLDWLRVLVVLTLIPFHAALTYSGLGDTYIASPLHDVRIIPFMLIVSPLGNFFMVLLFFVSGIASFYSIQSRGIQRYASERRDKLLIPLGIGTLLLCPLQAYFKALYDGFSGNFFEFFPEFFNKMAYYMGYAHLWFLLYLYVFSMVCIPLFKRWKGNPQILSSISGFLCRGHRILYPVAFIVIVEVILRPVCNGQYTIVGDWANDIVYLSFFVFGYVFAANSDIRKKIEKYFNISILLIPFCLAALFHTFWSWAVKGSGEMYLTYLWVFAKGVYECAAVIALLGIGRRFLDRKSPLLGYLNNASFAYYLFHYLPVSLFTYLLIGTNLNVYLKFGMAVVFSYIFIIILYELIRRVKNVLKAGRRPNKQSV